MGLALRIFGIRKSCEKAFYGSKSVYTHFFFAHMSGDMEDKMNPFSSNVVCGASLLLLTRKKKRLKKM